MAFQPPQLQQRQQHGDCCCCAGAEDAEEAGEQMGKATRSRACFSDPQPWGCCG